MSEIILIRHGATKGNLEKRYIGITDEHLSKDGIEKLKSFVYPKIDVLYSSPMKRCKETCEIIYKDIDYNICESLRECNFGDFENKNYIELSDNPDYKKWVYSNGKLPFPNGESIETFEERSFDGFFHILSENKNKIIGIIAHGGTIMSIMKKLSDDEFFYKWQLQNGNGYRIKIINKRLDSVEKLW